MAARTALLAGLVTIVGAAALVGSPAPASSAAVRACAYVPGRSEPAAMPPGVDGRSPGHRTLQMPAATGDPDPATVKRQGRVLIALAKLLDRWYLYPDALEAWGTAAVIPAAERIAEGLDDRGFEALLDWVMDQLGDEHSFVESPQDVAEADAAEAGHTDFVGIGVYAYSVRDEQTNTVIAVHPGSPAERAGLRPHDTLVAVDGQPFLDAYGTGRSRGPEGTSFTLTYDRPGEGLRDATLTRQRVTSPVPIGACLVPGTRIGYILLPTFFDASIDDQVRDALTALTADGPLDGLVLDDRANGGGLDTVLYPMLETFTSGLVGAWVDRDSSDEVRIEPQDVGGSQSVPLVVLIGPDTNSFAEIFAGAIQATGRATLMGTTTLGNVEELYSWDLPEGWRVRIATDAFRPSGDATGTWETTGIRPDVVVPSRWDLFSEATDPGLAAAVDLLSAGSSGVSASTPR
jgi:carboxyl-terminal processing protease